MNRRHWMAAGVAAAAGAAGAGWAWWRERQLHQTTGGLWQRRFDTPQGGTLDMAGLRGRPLVLNFWATWCPPCVKEMPELDRFGRDFAARGWQVVGLAVDGPTPVREFLARNPVTFPIGMAGFEGTELARALGNMSGGLPFTVIFADDGNVAHRKMGQTDHAELSRWAAELG